jgi:SSS family solute:Na+ symporter
MDPMRPEFFGLFAGYLVVVFAAGLAFSRRMKTQEDFFLASRGLSAGLIYVSLTSAWFGATSILVTADEALRIGAGALWIVGLPAVATVVLLAVVFARPLHRLSVMTWSEIVELRYGRTTRHLTSALLVWYMAVLAASQMVALGKFLAAFLGLSYGWSVAAGTAVVVGYAAFGGLRSVVFTDLVQFVLLAAGVATLFVLALGRASWADVAAASAGAGRPGFFDVFHDFGNNALIFFSFTLAWTISPIALQRIQAGRSVRAARRGLAATAATLLVLYLLVVLVGMLSLPAFPGGPPAHPLVAEFAAGRTGFLAGGLIFVAVLAAILSTMDTAVNAGALVLARDVIDKILPRARRNPVAWSRVATLAVALAGLAVALRFTSVLKTLGLSSEIMAEGFFVPGAAMIFMKRPCPQAGLFSLVLGSGFALASFLGTTGVLSLGLPAWPRSVPYGVAASLAGFGLGWGLDRFRRRKKKYGDTSLNSSRATANLDQD